MNKINNPYLKQLISEIASKTAEGRITGVSWGLIDETKRKKSLKKEADEKKKEAPAEEPSSDTGGLPPLGGADETPKDAPKDAPKDTPKDTMADKEPSSEKDPSPKPDAAPAADAGQEDVEKAKEDSAKAKAELEKEKAETDKAKSDLKKQSYVKLSSHEGTGYLLQNVLNNALKQGGTIDALAADMVQKLKIQTQDDAENFANDVAEYMTMPGMAQLVSSIKPLTKKKPETTEEPSA